MSRRGALTTQSFFNGDIRCIGLGFYWAWLFATFYTSVLFPSSPDAAQQVRDLWNWAAWAHVIALLAGALFARRLQGLALKKTSIALSSACSCVGTLLVPLGQLLYGFLPAATVAATVAGALLTGAGTAWIVLSWGVLYSKHGARFSLFGIIASYVLSVALFFLVHIMSEPVAIATTVLLPACSGLLLHAAHVHDLRTSAAGEADGENRPGATGRRPVSGDGRRRFSPRVALPLAAVFLYALCGEVLREFATTSGDQAGLDAMGNLYLLGTAIGLVVMGAILALIPAFTHKRPSDMPGIRATLLIMAGGFLITTLTSASFLIAYAVFGAAFQCFRSLVWMYSADVAERTGAPAFSVFGATQACAAAAVVLGVPIARALNGIVSVGAAQWTTIASAAVFLIFTTAVFVVNPKDLESAWGLIPGRRGDADDPKAPDDAGAIDADELRFLVDEFGLTTREHEVAQLLARGRSLPFIQEELHIAQGTAQTHLMHIYRKLDVHTRQEFLDVIQDRRAQP